MPYGVRISRRSQIPRWSACSISSCLWSCFWRTGCCLPPSCRAIACWCWLACSLPKAQWASRKRYFSWRSPPASAAGLAISRATGWATRVSSRTGYRIFPPIITSARTTCSISMVCLPCWLAALSLLSAPCCRPSPACPGSTTRASSSLTGWAVCCGYWFWSRWVSCSVKRRSSRNMKMRWCPVWCCYR